MRIIPWLELGPGVGTLATPNPIAWHSMVYTGVSVHSCSYRYSSLVLVHCTGLRLGGACVVQIPGRWTCPSPATLQIPIRVSFAVVWERA